MTPVLTTRPSQVQQHILALWMHGVQINQQSKKLVQKIDTIPIRHNIVIQTHGVQAH